MVNKLKEITDRQINEFSKTMHEDNENINKEIEIIRKNQTEIPELRNTITKLRNSLEGFNSRFHQAKQKESANLKTGHLKSSSKKEK